ncbi:MAG: hypothetical protein JSS26_08340 [Nitrospira sp.]|nr:hypothetical protein [Nitrospira sp.]
MRKTKTHRITATIDDETMMLLEAWRKQNYIGRRSRANAVWGILSIYLGQSDWKGGPPGIGAAWQQTAGWNLQDPRMITAPTHPETRLRLI